MTDNKTESTNHTSIKDTDKNSITEYETFDDMNLNNKILRGIYTKGWEEPSVIQRRAIIQIINGKDLIIQSQSGTGKTGTFIIGILQKIKLDIPECQAIIISPTRELARQSISVCKSIGQYMMEDISVVSCIGGTNIRDSRKELINRTSIVIGTPGRIIDMLNRGYLYTDFVNIFVLDEADELLRSNFQEQVKSIITSLHNTTQICLVSATMPQEVIELADQFLKNPMKILIKQDKLTLEGIKQYYINVRDNKYKLETICDLYKWISVNQSIIYANTVDRARYLKEQLEEKNFVVSVIYSKGMTMDERINIMNKFISGESRVLISTDLLSRGIDVHRVRMVINYDIPKNKESYLHRIGRSGRYGRKGIAITLITDRDGYRLRELEHFYATKIEPMPKPETITF
uniref:DEAD/SNF2-like helicase n=1 Tax=Mimivirus LCMiAC01 TaxID=2506608 RepID=A0A481Z0Q9_9VIRU|nr:MAG: DEAD/SNF2-like helicase [Mimivirus LCMiAC01]